MWLELAPGAVMGLNAAVLLLLHALSVAIALKLPLRSLARDGPLTRLRQFEADGRLYERSLVIRRWKDKLPDGGSWISGGFSKRSLQSGHTEYLSRFTAETRRGELAHWMMLLPIPLFFLWNNAFGMIVILIYSLIANIPCILVQRYNRSRLLKAMSRKRRL